jgi:hypothetical protein
MKLGLSVAVLAASALAGTCFAQGAPAASPGAASATTPAANTTPTPASTPPKRNDPNTVICKWTEELGTRLGGGKTCMTRAQWDEQARDSQDQLNDVTAHGHETGFRMP